MGIRGTFTINVLAKLFRFRLKSLYKLLMILTAPLLGRINLRFKLVHHVAVTGGPFTVTLLDSIVTVTVTAHVKGREK